MFEKKFSKEYIESIYEYFPESKKLSDLDLIDFIDKISDKDDYNIKKIYQYKIGKYENHLSFNEVGYFDDNVDFFDYTTLYDVTKDWYKFQKEHRINVYKKHSINKMIEINKDFNIYLNGEWISYIENDILYYGQLISLKTYLFDELNNYITSFLKRKLKLKYNDLGIEDFDFNTDSIYLFNNKKQQEKYEILNKFFTIYIHEYLELIINDYIKNIDCVFIEKNVDYNRLEDNFISFIYPNNECLKKIRTKTLFTDTNKCLSKEYKLKNIIRNLKRKIKINLEQIAKFLEIELTP